MVANRGVLVVLARINCAFVPTTLFVRRISNTNSQPLTANLTDNHSSRRTQRERAFSRCQCAASKRARILGLALARTRERTSERTNE